MSLLDALLLLPDSKRVSEISSPTSPTSPPTNPESLADPTNDVATEPPALLARLHTAQERPAAEAPEPERNRWPDRSRAPIPLRRRGALVCRTCHVHSPSPHREGCAFPRFEPCCSRWFWLSPHGAIKCVVCASPAGLALVEAWVLARETGEGQDGWRIPEDILSLLHIASPPQ